MTVEESWQEYAESLDTREARKLGSELRGYCDKVLDARYDDAMEYQLLLKQGEDFNIQFPWKEDGSKHDEG